MRSRRRFANGKLKSDGVTLRQYFSEDDNKELREHGVSAVGLMIDGALWSPAAVGITLAGTSVMLRVAMQQLLWDLKLLRDDLAANPRFLEEQFAGRVEFPPSSEWTFYLHDEGYGVQETRTGATYILRDKVLPYIPLDAD